MRTYLSAFSHLASVSAGSFFTLAVFSLLLTSCTSMMNTETCRTADWERVGQQDGRNGRLVKEFRKDEAKCEDLGVPIDTNGYFRGYASGITAYCTRANGQYVGLQGADYHKECPPSLESEFLSGYVAGKRDFDRNEIEQQRTKTLAEALSSQKAQCTFNSDCKVERSCDFSKCGGSGHKCTFDSDCEIEGDCTFGKCKY